MELYEYRKKIQKLYTESIYGNTKGDIYNELSDLSIDNNFIVNIKSNTQMRTVMFTLNDNVTDRDVASLLSQIKNVIKDFILKNISKEENENLIEFLETDLCYDSYILNNNIIVQL